MSQSVKLRQVQLERLAHRQAFRRLWQAYQKLLADQHLRLNEQSNIVQEINK